MALVEESIFDVLATMLSMYFSSSGTGCEQEKMNGAGASHGGMVVQHR
jgi:hypothetical protein